MLPGYKSNIDGEAVDDQSGKSVSLSADGSVVAIGLLIMMGFTYVSIQWKMEFGYKSDKTSTARLDQSGKSVLSADGSVVAIGAPNHGNNNNYTGHVIQDIDIK